TLSTSSFKLITTPGSTNSDVSQTKLFPTNKNDSYIKFVPQSFQIAETETTYSLWYEVFQWAIINGYYFQDAGSEGSSGTIGAAPTSGNTEPVSSISWRDAIVWCNALTEYYNLRKGTSLKYVYSYNGSIIRDSRDSNATACDNAVQILTADGFRLPTTTEWEFVARYRGINSTNAIWKDGTYYTKGDSASGATANDSDYSATSLVAWCANISCTTHPVKTKTQNTIGLYDMSGNVWEYCFEEFYVTSKPVRGGGMVYGEGVFGIGINFVKDPDKADSDYGFRFCRNK
ncbi:MAG TPA: SUMF1/EgtB/PvdO family nonheme iron enzyme, partial [Spirochaetota bacterium]|nr:SUMF1/EgtB/PvdO family nonheme iron enzyme [Spirochaetota bacterium]